MSMACARRRRCRRVLPAAACVLLAAGLLSRCAAREADAGRRVDPFEPTVTARESRLLSDVMELAATNTAAAVELLLAERSDDPGAALDFALGNLYFQQDRLEDAAFAYESALEKHPKFRSAVMNLGRVYLLQGQTGRAIALYQELAADGQATADILLLLGHGLLMEDCPVSAESAYRQSLLLKPKQSEAMTGLAKALLRQERYAEGLALVGEILRLEPANRELWAIRANALLALDRNREAAVAIEGARRLGCAGPDMLATLGDLYLNRDQPREALAAYEAAFAGGDPAIPRMLRAAEGFLMVDAVESAAAMVERIEGALAEKAGEAGTASAAALLRLRGNLARRQGDTETARACYREILRIDPLDGKVLLLLGDLDKREGRLEDALIAYERAARVRGYEADALVRQAQVEVARERYGRAVELLEAAQAFREQPHVARYLEQVRRLRR